MYLDLNHQRLDAYTISKELVIEVYNILKYFPHSENFILIPQIKRAVISIHLNIAEGCSKRSGAERKRFFEIARGSLVEVDTALDIANSLNYLQTIDMAKIPDLVKRTFQTLSRLIKA